MGERLLDHPRAFTHRVAGLLSGEPAASAGVTGFLSSATDAFLNQFFASRPVAPRDAAEALQGRPGFVWLTDDPRPEELGSLQAVVMHGMTATLGASTPPPTTTAAVAEVRSPADLDAWHEVYCEVFGVDPGGRGDWQTIHDALGPAGDGTLTLLLASVDGAPAATGAVYVDGGWAGLYCFTTRAQMRGRGLATALVHASHEAALASGVGRGLLQATPMGRRVYAAAGYEERRRLPVLVSR